YRRFWGCTMIEHITALDTVGRVICHKCNGGYASVYLDWMVTDHMRCIECGSGLTVWTPEKSMTIKDQAPQTLDVLVTGVKHDADKLRYDLLPSSLEEVVYVYTHGAKKYTDRNWEKGLKWSRVFAAMMRHAWDWWWSKHQRHESNMHHLGSVVWCALALMEYEKTHPELDDRSFFYKEKANGAS
ncbi:MAG: dATP/dGTP diphosphohydrolase domain-containing protein, partial [Nitrososphaera sp.]